MNNICSLFHNVLAIFLGNEHHKLLSEQFRYNPQHQSKQLFITINQVSCCEQKKQVLLIKTVNK